MKLIRSFPTFSIVFLLLVIAVSSLPRAAQASEALSFHVTTRVAYHDESGSVPEQTVEAKVLLLGKHVRIETQISGRRVVLLYAPPYAYRLYPESRTGTRYNTGSFTVPGLPSQINMQGLISNPGGIRALIQRAGGQKVGTGTLDGNAVDVFKSDRFMNKPQHATAWLRRSDALPVRLEVNSQRISAASSWHDYKHVQVSSSLFGVPDGYRIRNGENQ